MKNRARRRPWRSGLPAFAGRVVDKPGGEAFAVIADPLPRRDESRRKAFHARMDGPAG
ncbi:MAG: hypothetical protein JW929_14150 [Anaerolineales bacterium]|nr:hypothetical protein [Anaerolineales bacterium]